MATFEHVRAGDVISSDFFNSLLDKVAELEGRIVLLEKGGGTSHGMIDRFDPPSQVQVGQVLTMYGSFDSLLIGNNVSVDGHPVTSFRPGSNNLQLIFLVPSQIQVPTEGRNVIIKVTNTKGTDQKSYRLLPAAPSTVPSPTITNVVDADLGSSNLRTGKKARITGKDFAATPGDNIIRFRIQSGSSTVIYPKQGQPPLTIDPMQTNPTQIVVTVPVIEEISLGSTSPVALEVGVGSAVPAAIAVTVARMP